MAFDINTITVTGLQLLAAATADNKLILEGCDATTTIYTLSQAQNVRDRVSSPYTTSTNVSKIGSTENHVIARAVFEAGVTSGGDVHSLLLYGHLESSPTQNYVICVSSSNEPFSLPSLTSASTVFEALFDMVYSVNSDAVTASTTSTYLTMAEYNLDKPKIDAKVSAHKVGEPEVGEWQNVYGHKQFLDSVYINEIGKHEYEEGYSDSQKTLVSANLSPNPAYTAPSFGDTLNRFSGFYGDIGFFKKSEANEVHTAKIGATYENQYGIPAYSSSTSCATITLTTTNPSGADELNGTIKLSAYNYGDEKEERAAISIVSSSSQVVVTGTLNAPAIQSTVISVLDITVDDRLTITQGSDLICEGTIETKHLECDSMIPPLPEQTSPTTIDVPIGAIVGICIFTQLSATDLVVGTNLEVPANPANVYIANFNNTVGKVTASAMKPPSGKYRIIFGGVSTAASEYIGCLVIRIE